MFNLFFKLQIKRPISHKIKRVNPHVSWIVLLRFVFATVFILIASSLYLLYQIKNEKIFVVDKSTVASPSVLNESLLEKVNKNFEAREAVREVIETNDLLYKDPSLTNS